MYTRARARDLYSCAVIEGLKYAASHEWAKIEGDVATIGITDHAQVRNNPPSSDAARTTRREYALTVLCLRAAAFDIKTIV